MKHLRTLLVIVFALALAPFWQASAANRTADLTPGQSFSWEGAATPNFNPNYHENLETGVVPEVDAAIRGVSPSGTCSSSQTTYCETVLVSFTNPVPDTDADGKLTKTAVIKLTNAKGDVDLEIFESDAEGTKGAEVGQSAGPLDTTDHTDLDETVNLSVATTRPTIAKPTQADKPTKWYLVQVVYYSAAGHSGSITF